MLLYLVMATVLAEICQASNMQNLIEFSNKETVCTVLGLITNWIVNITSVESSCIIIWTITIALMHLKCSHYSSTGLSTHWKILTDLVYLLFVTLLPLVVMWMPLKNGNYGMAIACAG